MTITWLFSRFSDAQFPCHGEYLERYLAPEELTTYRAFSVQKRKMEWLASRISIKQLVQHGCAAAGDLPLRSIRVRKMPHGVPYVELDGRGRVGWLSLSHSNRGVLAAFSADERQRFGVDLEYLEERSPEFVADYFCPSESRWLNSTGGDERMFLVNLIWSAKEAYLKAIEKGLSMDTRVLEIEPIGDAFADAAWRSLDFRSSALDSSGWRLLFKRTEDFVLTMCIPAGEEIRMVRTPADIHAHFFQTSTVRESTA